MESLKDFGITGVVTWHQTDIREEMRPSAFLNIAQELANFHADKLGFGYDDLIKSEQVWVLSRIRVKFNRALSCRSYSRSAVRTVWSGASLSLNQMTVDHIVLLHIFTIFAEK